MTIAVSAGLLASFCEGNNFMFHERSVSGISLEIYHTVSKCLSFFLPILISPRWYPDTNHLFILSCEPSLTLSFSVSESNCQMRTLDSGIGTFPLPESGNRSMGRYICPPDSPEEPDPLLSLQPAPSAASSIRAQTLEREVPSSAESQCSTKTAIVHSVSDPVMMTRGMRPQSRLPKPASSGIMPITFQVRRFLPAVMHFLTKMENCPPGEEKNQ